MDWPEISSGFRKTCVGCEKRIGLDETVCPNCGAHQPPRRGHMKIEHVLAISLVTAIGMSEAIAVPENEKTYFLPAKDPHIEIPFIAYQHVGDAAWVVSGSSDTSASLRDTLSDWDVYFTEPSE